MIFCAIVMGIPIAALCIAHYRIYDNFNVLAQSLIGFLVVNVFICVWELALFYRFDCITKVHTRRLKDGFYKGTPEGAALRDKEPLIVFRNYPIAKLLSLSTWSEIWSDYARYDVSYTDKSTFGYNIDVGNGHSTFITSVLLLICMVHPLWSPRVVGIVGVVLFYQKAYGTVIYLFAYVNNKRYTISTWNEIIFCVICTNILWILFPMLGFSASVDMIMNDTFALIQ